MCPIPAVHVGPLPNAPDALLSSSLASSAYGDHAARIISRDLLPSSGANPGAVADGESALPESLKQPAV